MIGFADVNYHANEEEINGVCFNVRDTSLVAFIFCHSSGFKSPGLMATGMLLHHMAHNQAKESPHLLIKRYQVRRSIEKSCR